jgi:hypothetical protein
MTFPFKFQIFWIIILLNFIIVSLCQGVKRKQALPGGDNLSAINTPTVCSNATFRRRIFCLLFCIADIVFMTKKTQYKSYRKQTFHSRLLLKKSCKFFYQFNRRRESHSNLSRLQRCNHYVVVSLRKAVYVIRSHLI